MKAAKHMGKKIRIRVRMSVQVQSDYDVIGFSPGFGLGLGIPTSLVQVGQQQINGMRLKLRLRSGFSGITSLGSESGGRVDRGSLLTRD